MTDTLRWPNVMAALRDRAAEEAIAGISALRPLVEGERLTETEALRRQAKALAALQQVARCMERAGAPTRPEVT